MAAQRPDADTISMQLRNNMSNRLACGHLDPNISHMLFATPDGARIPGNPKGRIGVKIHGGQFIQAQGFYSKTDWIEKYFKENNLPINIYGNTNIQQDYAEKTQADDSIEDLEAEMSEADFDMFKA